MKYLLSLYFGAAGLLWFSVFGYILLLGVIVLSRRHVLQSKSSSPDIAVIIPTLNEEGLILQKLADLRRTDYPSDRMTVVVVDGGSVDQTTALVLQEIARGQDIQLLCLPQARGRHEQINHVLGPLTQDIVVITNVDSVLEPSCIRELVNTIEQDSDTAVVGATVWPDSYLLEERIYWWFLNYLWWLEGEVLSSAGVCAVCYAFRRDKLVPLAWGVHADDVHVALAASSRGSRVRLCRTAHATEVRVPQTASELVQVRCRRGADYLSELRRSSQYSNAPLGWHVVRLIRLWHFLVTPKLGIALAVCSVVLLGTSYYMWPLLTLVGFAAPVLAVLFTSRTLRSNGCRWWRLGLAISRLLALTLFSMLKLNSRKTVQSTSVERE